MSEKYRYYFDIDQEYFPAVNEAVIMTKPEMWKKFFPHETFIRLVRNTVDALERKQKLSLWVEGAYGTGKSHAVLTLKKLLDSDEEDVRGYFQKYALDADLCKRFQSVKSSGRILTVHRYGSASIRNDHNLVFAVQESIEKSLAEAGIENRDRTALKDATIAWLSDSENGKYFDDLITGVYSDTFGGDGVETVLEKLRTYSGDALTKVMDNIFHVAEKRNIKAFSLSVTDLCNWIREVIRTNHLKAIVFIWDEFTEYFRNNVNSLTGFQELCEISETAPFYFILVTHVTQGLFPERHQDYIKLNGRFISPHSLISLPENIAFQLMGAAMRKHEDPVVLEDWRFALDELSARTQESRKLVQSVSGIRDEEMTNILPIHPYAALLLKHMSSAFDSNQRSMFDFIKNDRGDEIKGFQNFIDTYGPYSDNPLLSVDMLWEFFYEKQKEHLARDIRSVLDYFNRVEKQIDSDEKRTLKTILLLQAISLYAGDSVELFIPNEKNLNNAFEGTDMEGSAARCAEKLIREKILYRKSLGGGKYQYAAYDIASETDVAPFEKQIDEKGAPDLLTKELADGTNVTGAVALDGALKLRYEPRYVSASNFDAEIRRLRNTKEKYENKIAVVTCFARDEAESAAVGRKIQAVLADNSRDLVFIDASRTPFGADYRDYRHEMALSMAYQRKDGGLASEYAKNAKERLKKWKDRISAGEFIVYTAENREGERAIATDDLFAILSKINRKKFPLCLEGAYKVNETMFRQTNLKQGVECAVNETVAGLFKSGNAATKLETALEGAWKEPDYWKSRPNLLISKIKIRVDEIIKDGFAKGGRISFKDIYDVLKAAPYGFMPCNLTAFILGFVLKEYVKTGGYSWSDGLVQDTLNTVKLKEAINEVIRLETSQDTRYKNEYIVATTPEENAFNEIVSTAFGIPRKLCASVPDTRERIREKMKEYSFPIWTLKHILDTSDARTDKGVLREMIDLFCGIANNNNMGRKTESDIAAEIGKLSIDNPEAASDLKVLLSRENCTKGMIQYLASFEDGELGALSEEIDDGGQYIDALRKKFDADAANWVWNIDTARHKIQEVILEYRIIVESNKINPKNIAYAAAVREWLDKCGRIRISYAAARNHLNELGRFLNLLHEMKKSGTLQNSQKQTFLELLRANAESFRNFYENQIDWFKKVCALYLDKLDDEEINKVFQMIPLNSFTLEKADYFNAVDGKVKSYRKEQKSARLKELWKTQTGTDTPREWSLKRKTPILCLIPDDEIAKAKAAFDAVNRSRADEASIMKAIEYFNSAAFFNLLDDGAALDLAFRNNIVKNYAVMLDDMEEVREYLYSHLEAEPFDWFGLPEVEKKLRLMAEAKYNQGGYQLALEKINEMDVADVKKYLKDLITDNMLVGMEIIKWTGRDAI